jgi:hypothetical protein
MKRTYLTIGYVGLMIIVAFNLIACSPAREARAIEGQVVENQIASSGGALAALPETAGPSCANPTPEMTAGCGAEADRILASTVRIEFHGPGGGIGHATVVGGRYLITHNHYPVSGEALSRGGDGLVTAVSVFKANGDIILLKAPPVYFTVVAMASEALVLDFQAYSGVGFFESLGVPSADTRTWDTMGVQPGGEVAQIDWNGSTAHVTWARVTAVYNEGGAPYVELDTFVEQGASGGGVFYNGYHIANNWSRNTDHQADTGAVLRQYSLAALNTVSLAVSASEVASVGN